MKTNITDIEQVTGMSLGTIGTPTDKQTEYLLKAGGDSVSKYAQHCGIPIPYSG